MKTRIFLFIGMVVGVAILGTGVFLALSYQWVTPVGRGQAVVTLRIVVTTSALEDMVNNLIGEDARVVMLVPMGKSPFDYECGPVQIEEVALASVFVRNGPGVEGWADKAINQASNTHLIVVNILDGIPLAGAGSNQPVIQGIFADGFSWKLTPDGKQVDVGGTLFSVQALDLQSGSCPGAICLDWMQIKRQMEDSGSTLGLVSPDAWHDPVLAQQQVKAIAEALAKADPGNADFYWRNAEIYVAKLGTLNETIGSVTALFTTRDFVSLDPAWNYFADRYGLSLPVIIEVGNGKEVSTIQMDSIVETVKTLGVKVVFAGSQFSGKAADRITAESGARVVVLDSTVASGVSGGHGYLDMMNRNLEIITSAMK